MCLCALQVGVRRSGTWPLHGEAGRSDQEPRQRHREDVQPPLPGLRGLHHGAAQSARGGAEAEGEGGAAVGGLPGQKVTSSIFFVFRVR